MENEIIIQNIEYESWKNEIVAEIHTRQLRTVLNVNFPIWQVPLAKLSGEKVQDIKAEYSLRGFTQQLGIAEYETQKILNDVKSSLPSIEEIEASLNTEN